METFIRDSLSRIYTEFRTEIDTLDDLCEIKNCHYENNNIPNYSSKLSQQLYLLRYFPIYLHEYYNIYCNLFKSNFLDMSEVNIASLGAGCGLDFYGFYWATKKYNLEINCEDNYTGLDIIQWNYQNLIANNSPKIIAGSIMDLVAIKPIHNIFIFPKSIGEFNNDCFNHILNVISNSQIIKEKIVLITSMIDSQVNYYLDRIIKMARIISEKGYQTNDNIRQYFYLAPEFDVKDYYTPEIRNFIKMIYQYCQKHVNCLELNYCKRALNRYPIYSSRYIKYSCIKFEKVV